eukprot:TRINITY_DN672_c0_g1_i1.p1 TRINITY_DN672_c0_g1~~TRINITY_DN672_c0_g1_i1.p1  ORF type:complete len:284 (-),score=107.79 TRINITY_DN672_c0_g1_i1:28-879(-)
MADLPPATTEQIRTTWTNFADYYGVHFQKMTNQVYNSVLYSLDLQTLPEGGTVLETACGAGEGLATLSRHAPHARISALDLSPRMVEMSQALLSGVSSIVEIKEGDNEHLPFPDASFNRYISNLSLHIVADTDAMLREARRVLVTSEDSNNPSIAVFSVWGRKENSSFFTLMPKVVSSLGISTADTTRSSFHLGGDLNALRKRAIDAGFKSALAYYHTSVFTPMTAEAFAAVMLNSPRTQQDLEKGGEEMKKKITETLLAEAQAIIDSGSPICWENAVLVAFA